MSNVSGEVPIRHRTRSPAPPETPPVTADLVTEVIRLIYETYRDDDFPDWDQFLRDANRNHSLWFQYFDDDPTATFERFGDAAPKIRAVMDVARVILAPPPISAWTRVTGYAKPDTRI